MSAFEIPGLARPAANVYGIGRNYAAHARELGNAVPTEPVVFLKPTAALSASSEIVLRQEWGAVDHEAEVVVAMGEGRKIAGLGVGIDLTAREIQSRLKAQGLPWALSKGKRGFAPLGRFVPFDAQTMDLKSLEIRLWVGNEKRQDASSALMIFPIERLIADLDREFGLQAGDLIFTGTPAGVGPLVDGDRVRVEGVFGPERISAEWSVRSV